jgi:hypothetical protein
MITSASSPVGRQVTSGHVTWHHFKFQPINDQFFYKSFQVPEKPVKGERKLALKEMQLNSIKQLFGLKVFFFFFQKNLSSRACLPFL